MNRLDPPTVFDEPWQAQAFGITVQLHAAGAFTWAQWTAAFGRVLAKTGGQGENMGGQGYYEAWLEALESLMLDLGLADLGSLVALKAQWAQAYEHTPHGQPVVLPQSHAWQGARSL